MELRDYQVLAIGGIWKDLLSNQTALCVMSTGSGKSIVISGLIQKAIKAKPDIKILVLFNKVTLLEQLAERFKNILGKQSVGIYCSTSGEWDLSKQVTVGSIQSIEKDKLNFNLIVCDECHNLDDQKGKYIDFLKHQMDMNPKTKVVGFTATPYRADGFIYGDKKFWRKPSFERGLSYFIDLGMLVLPIAKQPNHLIDVSRFRVRMGEYVQADIDKETLDAKKSLNQAVDALERACGRKKVVWFCASIKHAELIRDTLLSLEEDAVSIHSNIDWDLRERALNDFVNGSARHLTFVSIVSEGFDYPPIDCVVLLRPTRSPTLMVQTCGRGLRPHGDKKDCLILDYANVISTLGPLDNPRVLKTKKGKFKKGMGSGDSPQKVCPACKAYIPVKSSKCYYCGHEYENETIKKLNKIADERLIFLSNEYQEKPIERISLDTHMAKSGNKCLRINYYPPGFFVDPVREYFVPTNPIARSKMLGRFQDLGIEIKSSLEDQIKERPKIIPKKIKYKIDGKLAKNIILQF